MQSSDSAIGGETEQRQTIGHFRSLCAVGSVDQLDHLSNKSSSRLRSTEQARYGMIDRPEIATATLLSGDICLSFLKQRAYLSAESLSSNNRCALDSAVISPSKSPLRWAVSYIPIRNSIMSGLRRYLHQNTFQSS
jgi:hypothetical protein